MHILSLCEWYWGNEDECNCCSRSPWGSLRLSYHPCPILFLFPSHLVMRCVCRPAEPQELSLIFWSFEEISQSFRTAYKATGLLVMGDSHLGHKCHRSSGHNHESSKLVREKTENCILSRQAARRELMTPWKVMIKKILSPISSHQQPQIHLSLSIVSTEDLGRTLEIS